MSSPAPLIRLTVLICRDWATGWPEPCCWQPSCWRPFSPDKRVEKIIRLRMKLCRIKPRRYAGHDLKRCKPNPASACHVMFGAVADAQDIARVPDDFQRMGINLRIGLPDPLYPPAHFFVECSNGPRCGLQTLLRQHELVGIAANRRKRRIGKKVPVFCHRRIRGVRPQNDNDVGLRHAAHKGHTLKAIILTGLANEKGLLLAKHMVSHFAGT